MAKPAADLELAEYLPYLLNRAGSRIAASFSEAVREYGITLPIWRVLAALHHREGQRMGELAQTTAIELSTLSRIVGTLVQRGLAERERPESNARTVTVRRTAEGRDLTNRVIPLAMHYEAVALAGFSAEEAAVLKTMLRRVYANMGVLEDELEAGGEKRSA